MQQCVRDVLFGNERILLLGFLCASIGSWIGPRNGGGPCRISASSFMIGRTITSYAWGLVADRYGRKFVLMVSILCRHIAESRLLVTRLRGQNIVSLVYIL